MDEWTMKLPASADGEPIRPGDMCYVQTGNERGHNIYSRQTADAVDETGVWFGGRRRDSVKVYRRVPETIDGLMAAMGELGMEGDQLKEALLLLETAYQMGRGL